MMNRMGLLLVVTTMLAAGSMATAKAVELHVGPGGISVGPDRHYYNEYRDEYGHCRVIVTRRINRFGEQVEVRRRICD
ncbi:MAG TPA: hypothetical protein VGJ20_42145 [Xanthobacteraceae bacterium]|jgi:hypothetical protein